MNILKPADECSYYLVREMFGMGVRAKDVYFDDMLQQVRTKGLSGLGLRHIEIDALIMAAKARDRLDELDAAVEAGYPLRRWANEHDG